MCMQIGQIPSFASQQDAGEWMYDQVDDPCVDNYRFAFLDDAEAVTKYEEQRGDGCCGFFDQHVTINGRLAKIGCNYGH